LRFVWIVDDDFEEKALLALSWKISGFRSLVGLAPFMLGKELILQRNM
jgi:hypothetical protein